MTSHSVMLIPLSRPLNLDLHVESHCLILSKNVFFFQQITESSFMKKYKCKTFQNFNYCKEWHCHHLSHPQMILTKTLVAKFSNSHGSAGSSVTASSDTWQKVQECLKRCRQLFYLYILRWHCKGSTFCTPVSIS